MSNSTAPARVQNQCTRCQQSFFYCYEADVCPQCFGSEIAKTSPELSELDRVLIAFGAAGHGRLFCTCGYLIWSCPPKCGCNFVPRMIETDHSLCKKKKKTS